VIKKLSAKHEFTSLFVADCAAPQWRSWGSDTDTIPGLKSTFSKKNPPNLRYYDPTNPPKLPNIPASLTATATPITDPTIIVDAIVHGIDRASKRQAPETDHKLQMDLEKFSKFQEERSLTREDMLTWEFTIEEVRKRETLQKELRVVELKDVKKKGEDA
jgi:hypothetical protein